jgi:hypothetical protein
MAIIRNPHIQVPVILLTLPHTTHNTPSTLRILNTLLRSLYRMASPTLLDPPLTSTVSAPLRMVRFPSDKKASITHHQQESREQTLQVCHHPHRRTCNTLVAGHRHIISSSTRPVPVGAERY